MGQVEKVIKLFYPDSLLSQFGGYWSVIIDLIEKTSVVLWRWNSVTMHCGMEPHGSRIFHLTCMKLDNCMHMWLVEIDLTQFCALFPRINQFSTYVLEAVDGASGCCNKYVSAVKICWPADPKQQYLIIVYWITDSKWSAQHFAHIFSCDIMHHCVFTVDCSLQIEFFSSIKHIDLCHRGSTECMVSEFRSALNTGLLSAP